MHVKIGGAGVRPVDGQIGAHLMQQQIFIVGVKTIIGAVVERLRAIGRLVLHVLLPVDGDECLFVEAERLAIRMDQAGQLGRNHAVPRHGVCSGAWLSALAITAATPFQNSALTASPAFAFSAANWPIRDDASSPYRR